METDMRQKFWLFFAGPESYLDENGERNLSGEMHWSCEPDTKRGDLALLYRKSINHLTVKALIRRFDMPKETAEDIKKRRTGKDISFLWLVTSDNLGPLGPWPASCYVQQIQKFNPTIKLDELKTIPALRRWEAFRWNFQASGRSALEIPPFAWKILLELIEKKYDLKINQQCSNNTDLH